MTTKKDLFIEKAIAKHGDKYDYSKVDYININTYVTIICSIHGEFKKQPEHHLRGQGCITCSKINNKYTTEQFIVDAKKKFSDAYDYSLTRYVGYKEYVIIICPSHGQFQLKAVYHLSGKKCPKCIDDVYTTRFIEKAKIKHNDKYDYSKSIYESKEDKLIIICKQHGEFKQLPQSHLNGNGCAKCAQETYGKTHRHTLAQFIEKAKNVHGDTYDYSKVNYINNYTHVTIICKIHGDFQQQPNNHLHNGGCFKCGNIKNGVSRRNTQDDFTEKAKKIHGDKYDYSKVIYTMCKEKVTIICPSHGEFQQTPISHLRNNGCIKCAKYMIGVKKCSNGQLNILKNTPEFIEKSKEIHGDKYDYTQVKYIGAYDKVIIMCPLHGEFLQTPYRHVSGVGCKKCSNIKRAKDQAFTPEEFIEKAKTVHGDKYDYSQSVYVQSKTKLKIICSVHGEFQQTPSSHLKGGGCKKCSSIEYGIRQRLTTDEFINKAQTVHGDTFDYSKVNYVDSHTRLLIGCKIHGDFYQLPNNHIYDVYACPKCILCPTCQIWRTLGKICDYCKPATQNKMYQKTKEYDVVKFLKEKLPDNDFIHNKSVSNECTGTHLFPDVRFDCKFYHLIVEIDEHKHRGADYKCDERRMYDIIGKLGMPCIFIRYNPDDKKSDKNQLLDKVKEYLALNIDDEHVWDEFGFKADYMFY